MNAVRTVTPHVHKSCPCQTPAGGTPRGVRAFARALIRSSLEEIHGARSLLLETPGNRIRRKAALRVIEEETDWLTSSDAAPFGFRSACETLSYNPRLIRLEVARELATVPAHGLRACIERLAGA